MKKRKKTEIKNQKAIDKTLCLWMRIRNQRRKKGGTHVSHYIQPCFHNYCFTNFWVESCYRLLVSLVYVVVVVVIVLVTWAEWNRMLSISFDSQNFVRVAKRKGWSQIHIAKCVRRTYTHTFLGYAHPYTCKFQYLHVDT